MFNHLHKINSSDSFTQGETIVNDNNVEIEFEQTDIVEFKKDEPKSVLNTEIQDSKDTEIKYLTDQKLLEIDENHVANSNDSVYPDIKNQLVENTNETQTATEEKSFEFDQMSIIDKFIEENPAFLAKKIDQTTDNQDISLDSIKEDDNLASETLANIFEMQKLYDKAIEVYEKLILKYPEKSAYFASRIETIKKIIK